MYIRGFFGIVIDRYLAAYVRRRRLLGVLRAFAWSIALAVTCVLLACVIDRFIALPAVLRAITLVVLSIAPIAIVARPIHWLFHRVDPVAAAADIERHHAAFGHGLVTLASPGGSPDLRAAVERDVLATIAATGPARVPRWPVLKALSAAVVAIAMYALLWRWPWLDLRDLTRRLVHPTAAIAAVTSTRLTVHPGRADVVEGKQLVINATVVGKVGPTGVTLRLSDDGGQTWTDRSMRAGPAGYSVTLADVDRDLLYAVTAGDAVSPTYFVRVRRVPGVAAIRVRLDYPPALHRASASDDDLTFTAPAGTIATVEVVSTVPLQQATLSVGNDRIEMAATSDPCARRAQFTVRRDERIDLRLTSTDGVTGNGPKAARIRVQRDPAGTVPGFEQQQRAYRDAMNRH